MSVATSADCLAGSSFATLAVGAVRGIRWRQFRAAMFLGLALTAWSFAVFVRPIAEIVQNMPLGSLLSQALLADQVKVMCLLVAIVIANRAVDEGARRRRAYALAALAGCVAGVALTAPFQWAWRTYLVPDLWPPSWPWLHGTPALFYWPIFELTHWLLIGGAVVFLYADHRAARKTAQLLRDAELDRIRRSKVAIESRLQAMQARVEPQFLFNTLAQVERLYELDSLRAARMLDDLIAYLRAAMPLMRDTGSTVAQEIALARAYLDIVRLRLADRLEFTIDSPPGAESIKMPPMMLLPLIDHAITYGLERSTAGGKFVVRTDASSDRLRLTITDSGAGFVPEAGGEGLNAIRERVTALYGDQGALQLRRSNGASSEAVLDIPLERRSPPGVSES